MAEIQTLLGGDIAGAAFKSDEEIQAEEKKTGKSLGGGNFIDKLDIDMARGTVTLEAKILSLQSIRYFYGDMLIQSGEGTLKGIRVHAGYPKDKTSAYFMKAEVESIHLTDILVTSPDSITAVGSADIAGIKLTSASKAVDYDHENQENEDNWFERLIQQIPILSPLANPFLGFFRMLANLGDIKKAFQQSGEFSISADSIQVAGVTMSNGEHIESIELGKASFRSGDQIEGYKRSLEASLATFPERITSEENQVANAASPEDKAAHQKALDRLNEQQARVQGELAQVARDQARIAELEQQKKTTALTQQQEQELANLKRGGTALDIETLKISGVSGRVSSGDLDLSERATGKGAWAYSRRAPTGGRS